MITVRPCSRPGEALSCMDYERPRDRQYVLTVLAADRLGEGHRTRVPVVINVTDANDNPPDFPQDEYGISLRENSTTFSPPLIVAVRNMLCTSLFAAKKPQYVCRRLNNRKQK